MTKDEKQNIIDRDLPGWQVSDTRGGPKDHAPAEAGTPTLEEMQRKYFGRVITNPLEGED